MPAGVTSVVSSAFDGCTALKGIVCATGTDLFNALQKSAYKNILSPEAQDVCIWLVTKNGETVVSVTGCPYDVRCTIIPREIEGYPVYAIAEKAFSGRDDMTNLALPEGLTEIGRWAFRECSGFARLYIPESAVAIGHQAFHADTVLYCHESSEADFYGAENGYQTVYVDGIDCDGAREVTMEEAFPLEVGDSRHIRWDAFPM